MHFERGALFLRTEPLPVSRAIAAAFLDPDLSVMDCFESASVFMEYPQVFHFETDIDNLELAFTPFFHSSMFTCFLVERRG